MSTGQRSGQEPSIRALVASAVADARRLAQAQVDLAKLEMQNSAAAAGKTGGLFVAAATLGFLGFVFLLVTLAYVLVALGLPVWAGFGIVTLLLLIVAGILGLVGRATARDISGPQQAKAEFERTKAALAAATGAGPTAAPVPVAAPVSAVAVVPPSPTAAAPVEPPAPQPPASGPR